MQDYMTTLVLMVLTIGVVFLQYQNSFLARDVYEPDGKDHRFVQSLCGVLCAVAVLAVCVLEACSHWLG